MITTTEELRQTVEDCILDMTQWEQFDLWNTYCEENKYLDDQLYYVSSLDEMLEGKSPLDILSLVTDDFNVNDEFCSYTIYGLKSSDFIDELADYDALIGYIVNTCDSLNNSDLKDILMDYKDPYENADFAYDCWRDENR